MRGTEQQLSLICNVDDSMEKFDYFSSTDAQVPDVLAVTPPSHITVNNDSIQCVVVVRNFMHFCLWRLPVWPLWYGRRPLSSFCCVLHDTQYRSEIGGSLTIQWCSVRTQRNERMFSVSFRLWWKMMLIAILSNEIMIFFFANIYLCLLAICHLPYCWIFRMFRRGRII